MGEKWRTEPIPGRHACARPKMPGTSSWTCFLATTTRSWRSTSRRRTSPEGDLRRALRTATIKNEVVPVLCGSTFKNKAVQPMLDAVVDLLPSPLDVPPDHRRRSSRCNSVSCKARRL